MADEIRDTGAAPRPVRQERIPLAIGYMIAATAIFTCGNAMSKWLVESYPVGEVLFTRSFVGLIACSILILPVAGFAVFRTQKPKAHLIRGVSQTTSQILLLIAFSMMPLASATAINFSAPLFAALASAYFLRERIGWERGTALVVGFGGVLIVSNPGMDTFQLGALFALGNAILFGTVTAGVRGMSKTESADTLTMYQLSFLTLAYGVLMLFAGFTMPTLVDSGWMIANGVANGLAQYLWTRAIHLAPTAAVTPFQYLQIVWAILLGFAVWGDVPGWSLIVGSVVVVAVGLFLLWHESRPRPAVPPAV